MNICLGFVFNVVLWVVQFLQAHLKIQVRVMPAGRQMG